MPCLIPITRIRELCDPISSTPWDCPNFTAKLVQEMILSRTFQDKPITDSLFSSASAHAARIAYLAVHSWTDPIDIDVGIPSMQCYPQWPILDGNHRLYAAWIRGDTHILASIGGSLDYAEEIFGVPADNMTEGAA